MESNKKQRVPTNWDSLPCACLRSHAIPLMQKYVLHEIFWAWERRAREGWVAFMMSQGPYLFFDLNLIQIKDKDIRRKEISFLRKEWWCQIFFSPCALRYWLVWERSNFFLTLSHIFIKIWDAPYGGWRGNCWCLLLTLNPSTIYIKGVQ